MLFLAAATAPAAAPAPAPQSTLERLHQIPADVWLKIGIGIVGLVVLVIVLRKVARVNKMVLGIVVFLALTIIGFNWIYERNEPAWATPVVQWLAGFFPSKGKVEQPPPPKAPQKAPPKK